MTEINKNPLVSICVPAYNHDNYVGLCIQSIIDQDYENIEFLIINDGSRDGTHDVISSFAQACEKRFVRFVFLSRENKGLPVTLNEMVDLARGEYIKVLASDDKLYQGSIKIFVDKMVSECLDVLYGRLVIIDEHDLYVKEMEGLIDLGESYTFNQFGLSVALRQSPTRGSAWVMRTESLRMVGKFDERSKIEDWDLILRVLHNRLVIGYIDYPSSYYRVFGERDPYCGSYYNWLKSDLYVLDKYKNFDHQNYMVGVRSVFKGRILGSGKNLLDFGKVVLEIRRYPFVSSIFVNPVFLFRIILAWVPRRAKKVVKSMLRSAKSGEIK